ncbi:MAG TPA: 50S ribosomal protein L11 methyltransferase [Solirubrobacteraceae bacterium]|nr:50S ribosomal protein L11 methyltransferase [Solirubrobacteraceae bacterium]
MIRLAVRVPRAQAELVLAELLELVPAGVEEVELGAGLLEFAVYGSPGELPSLPDLRAAAGDALVEISTSELPDDWHERWKAFHRPVLIEAPSGDAALIELPRFRVRPPWEAPSSPANGPLQEIVIDPGQAFGTGAHATTRLCLELLLEAAALQPSRGAVLDVGTGSGLLAIAAARLGFSPVIALDNERESVQAAVENAALNGAEVEVHRLDLRFESLPSLAEGRQPPGPVLVIANLLRPLLLELAGKLPTATEHLIAGGLLEREVDEVAAAFTERLGLGERERRQSGEWAAVWMAADDA